MSQELKKKILGSNGGKPGGRFGRVQEAGLQATATHRLKSLNTTPNFALAPQIWSP